jgi:serine/threonine protein kinase
MSDDRGVEFNDVLPPVDFNLENAWQLPEQILELNEEQKTWLENKIRLGERPSDTPVNEYDLLSKKTAPGRPRYVVERVPFGGGGFGQVYRGWDRKMGRYVAIKIAVRQKDFKAGQTVSLSDDCSSDTFEREAKTMARIKYPGVVEVYDYLDLIVNNGHLGGERILAIIEEFMNPDETPTLIDFYRKRRIDLDVFIKILRSIASTIDFLADKNIFHNDIKPENIFVLEDGGVKIADFGISSPVCRAMSSYPMTPNYAAPERRTGEITIRTEIYSLAVIAHEMYIRMEDFDNREKMKPVIDKGMSEDKKKRFRTATEFVDNLERSFQ